MTSELATNAKQALPLCASKTVLTALACGALTDKQVSYLKLIKIPPTATIADVQVFADFCAASRLDPARKQVYLLPLGKKEDPVITIVMGIDGYRIIAHRAGLDGIDEPEFEYGTNPNRPVKATVRVYRKGCSRPFVGVAYMADYNHGQPGPWQTMGRVMLAKCAEAQGIRKACPEETSGTYIDAELQEEESDASMGTAQVVQAAPPKAPPSLYDKCAEAWAARPVRSEGDDFLGCLREAAASVGVPLPKTDIKGHVAAMTNYPTGQAFLDAFIAAMPKGEATEEPAKAPATPWEAYMAKGGTSAAAYEALKAMGKTVRDESDLADAFNAAAESDKSGLVAALKVARESLAAAKAAEAPNA